MFLMFFLFFFGGPNYESSRSFKEFWNFGHIVFFAVFAHYFFCSGGALAQLSTLKKLLLTMIFSLLLGLFIEYIQYGINRDPDIGDVLRDGLGGLVGLFFSPILLNARLKIVVRVVLSVLLVVQGLPWLSYLLDEYDAKSSFPVLSDFESEVQSSRWTGSNSVSDREPKTGSGSLEVPLGTEKYSGVGLKYFPRDWSHYQSLYFDVFSHEQNFDITVRINDRQHRKGAQDYSDRFNRSFKLNKGWNSIVIQLDEVSKAPLTRLLDLSDVEGLGIFVVALSSPSILYIDNVKLQ